MSKILIIEDEPAIRRVLVKILAEEDKSHQIDEAENGIEAINKIKKESYDLIISDIKMPKVDGMEVLDFSKKNTPETPIIMISGHGDLELAVDSMKKGAFDYISKPPDLNRLLTTVRNALDRKQLVVENKLLRKKISKNFSDSEYDVLVSSGEQAQGNQPLRSAQALYGGHKRGDVRRGRQKRICVREDGGRASFDGD